MTDQNNIIDVKCDKVQLYNNHASLLKNGVKKTQKTTNQSTVRSAKRQATGLTARERRSINIDSISHLMWMIIILVFTLVNLYERNLDDRCAEFRATLITFSRLISSLTAIETTSFYLAWFFLTKSKYYHMQIIYDIITGTHIFVAFLNIFYAISTFLSRTCHENKLTADLNLQNLDKIHYLAYKYDLKISGVAHIFLTVVIVFSAIHLTTKRSKFTLHYLTKRNLLTEYLWEVID